MNKIRALFRPYQPSIDHSGEGRVSYEETEPADELKDYIYCYWRLRSAEPLELDYLYRVVSDGCIDILLEQSNPDQIYITGFSTKYLEYNLSKTFDYLGIRFLPTGFPAMFDISARKLCDNFLPLQVISPELYQTITETVTSPMTLKEGVSAFNDIFMSVLHERDPLEIDPRLLNAMHTIMESKGGINISELDAGVSERQLRRLFEFYFGESPKTFAKIIRFQNILGARPSSESLKHNKIFYNEGYYDQAHFIKEFKAFYGVTPGKAFGR